MTLSVICRLSVRLFIRLSIRLLSVYAIDYSFDYSIDYSFDYSFDYLFDYSFDYSFDDSFDGTPTEHRKDTDGTSTRHRRGTDGTPIGHRRDTGEHPFAVTPATARTFLSPAHAEFVFLLARTHWGTLRSTAILSSHPPTYSVNGMHYNISVKPLAGPVGPAWGIDR